MGSRNQPKSRKRVGRKPKLDPAVYRYGIRLNSVENTKFEEMFIKSGISEKTKFIKAILFNRPIKVVKIDKATTDYYMRLTNFYTQFQAIGNLYNQTVKSVRTNFGEKQGLSMLYRLEKATIQLVIISKNVIELTKDFEKHLNKD